MQNLKFLSMPILMLIIFSISLNSEVISKNLSTPISNSSNKISFDINCSNKAFLPYISDSKPILEIEPNNMFEDANGPMPSGVNYGGFANDMNDFFFFDLEVDGKIEISLTNFAGQGGQVLLYHHESSTSAPVAFVQESPYELEYQGVKGRYYIFLFTESGFDSTTPFNIRANYPTTSSQNSSNLYFTDHFCGDSIDLQKWEEGDGEPLSFFSVANGKLQSPNVEITACNNGWCQHTLHAKDNGTFSEMEAKFQISTQSTNGLMNFNTSCTVAPYSSMTLEINSDGEVIGRHEVNDSLVSLNWGHFITIGKEVSIRLIQEEDIVRAFVDSTEMPTSFPCPQMGDWFDIGSGSIPGGSLEGTIDYVKLYGANN